MARTLAVLNVNCVVDVGANEGAFARAIRKAGFQGRIVTFEPIAELQEPLARFAARDSDWLALQYALGRSAGSAVLRISRARDFSSLRTPTEYCAERFGDAVDLAEERPVEVRRLDDVFEEITSGLGETRALLKLDTQGNDLEVLEGARRSLQSVLALQAELSAVPLYEGAPVMSESLRSFERAGFTCAGMYPVSLDALGVFGLEFDCLMVRADRFVRATAASQA